MLSKKDCHVLSLARDTETIEGKRSFQKIPTIGRFIVLDAPGTAKYLLARHKTELGMTLEKMGSYKLVWFKKQKILTSSQGFREVFPTQR